MLAKEYLTAEEVSHKYGIAVGTLAQWRHHKKGPLFMKFGRSVRYRIEDLEKWAAGQVVLTSDALERK
jgi:predicted DNA-binding transcriptional regulator AlpA